jgi:hypothetical protein
MKIWDSHYFNSGLMVLHPNDKDFLDLCDAFENNTLTNGLRSGSHRHPKLDRTYATPDFHSFYPDIPYSTGRDPVTNKRILSSDGKPPYHGWFTGGMRGSLVDQDLFNAYFAYRCQSYVRKEFLFIFVCLSVLPSHCLFCCAQDNLFAPRVQYLGKGAPR